MKVKSRSKGGSMSCAEAGKLGGVSTKSRHGINHFKAAGRKGQAVFASRYTTDDRCRWGTLGGRQARVKYLDTNHMGERGKISERGMEPAR